MPRSYAIACASVIAKVTRDRLMARLALRYPGYGWERNAGYATRDHVAGLREHGVTRVHRRTYQRIRAILEGDQLALDLAGGGGVRGRATRTRASSPSPSRPTARTCPCSGRAEHRQPGEIPVERRRRVAPDAVSRCPEHRHRGGAPATRPRRPSLGHLVALGWTIVARNIRVGRDEVDIIAIDPEPGPTLVFVEVRSRTVTAGSARRRSRSMRARSRACIARRRRWCMAGRLPDGRAAARRSRGGSTSSRSSRTDGRTWRLRRAPARAVRTAG